MPKNVAESEASVRWTLERYLGLLEEFARNPETFETSGLTRWQAMELVRRAVRRKDGKAEEEAIAARMRVEVKEYWQDFPELPLLGEHYRRAALRKEGRRPPDSVKPPSEEEGSRLARAMLAHVKGRALLAHVKGEGQLDMEWESEAVATTLADEWLRARSRPLLRVYIKLSQTSRVYFDALGLIWEALDRRREAIPSRLTIWRQEVDGGRLDRPPKKPIPPYRPVTLPKYTRDLNIQLTVEILRRLGVKPEGSELSGLQVVTDALPDSEDQAPRLSWDTVREIWQERTWEGSYEPVTVKYSKAIAERNRPFHTTPPY